MYFVSNVSDRNKQCRPDSPSGGTDIWNQLKICSFDTCWTPTLRSGSTKHGRVSAGEGYVCLLQPDPQPAAEVLFSEELAAVAVSGAAMEGSEGGHCNATVA